MISILALSLAASIAEAEPAQLGRFSFPEAEPLGYDCVYRRLTPEDRATTQQNAIKSLEAAVRGDKTPLPKDPTAKDRKKRSIALSAECQAEFNIPESQMDGWVSIYTNAMNRADVIRRYLDVGDLARIDNAVKVLSPVDLAVLREKHAKNNSAVIIRLMQVVFKSEKPLDEKALIYSLAYMQALLSVRDIRVQWADWRRAEDLKAQAKAAAEAKASAQAR